MIKLLKNFGFNYQGALKFLSGAYFLLFLTLVGGGSFAASWALVHHSGLLTPEQIEVYQYLPYAMIFVFLVFEYFPKKRNKLKGVFNTIEVAVYRVHG